MPADSAEMSALASALEELRARVETMARRYEGTPNEDVLAALYEAERGTRAAVREIERAERLLG